MQPLSSQGSHSNRKLTLPCWYCVTCESVVRVLCHSRERSCWVSLSLKWTAASCISCFRVLRGSFLCGLKNRSTNSRNTRNNTKRPVVRLPSQSPKLPRNHTKLLHSTCKHELPQMRYNQTSPDNPHFRRICLTILEYYPGKSFARSPARRQRRRHTRV